MATDQTHNLGVNAEAGSDLSASKYCGMTRNDGTARLELPTAGGSISGVLYSKPTAAGDACTLMRGLSGTVIGKAGGTFGKGDKLKVTAAGKFITWTSGTVHAATAIGASGADGDEVEIELTGNTDVALAQIETLTGAGAASVDTYITELVATSDAITLPAGRYVGQRKILRLIAGSTGSNTVTPAAVTANTDGGTTPAAFTMTTIGQEIEYEYREDGWKCVRIQQAGTVDVAGAGTVNPLVADNREAISGTEVVTLPAGIYPGQEFYVEVISAAATPVLDVAGLFYDEDSSADGTNVTFDAAAVGNRMRCRWNGARWSVLSHTNAVVEV